MSTNNDKNNINGDTPGTAVAPGATVDPGSTVNNTKDTGTDSKNIPVPNTLTIFIKTRIPNHYKINYKPSMTVPKSKSNAVYFDPLVKYYKIALTDIPSEAPKDALFTQFFEANQFDSMINRILSSFLFMQKERTLKKATEEGLIDINIKNTIETLFKLNSLIYLDKRPYTIVGRHWTPGNWEIDKKPMQKLITYFSGDAVTEADKELEKIQDDLRQGNLAATDIVTNNLAANIDDLKNKKDQSTRQFESLEGLVSSTAEDEAYLSLSNPTINYSKVEKNDLDPMAFFLVSSEQIKKYISDSKDKQFSELYFEYMMLKDKLFNLSVKPSAAAASSSAATDSSSAATDSSSAATDSSSAATDSSSAATDSSSAATAATDSSIMAAAVTPDNDLSEKSFNGRFISVGGTPSTDSFKTQIEELQKFKKKYDEESHKIFHVKMPNLKELKDYLFESGTLSETVRTGLYSETPLNYDVIIVELEKLQQLKIRFFDKLKDVYKKLIEYLETQLKYFACILKMLQKIKENYVEITKMDIANSELAIKCIELDIDLYNLIQKHFKISLNEDKKIFNWYCKIRNKLEKQIVKQNGQNNENKNI
jgi:hypothetical protein